MKIFIIVLLILNMIVIACQQARISELLEELQQVRKDTKNKIRKKD